jgi:hypothetical protein
VIQTIALRAKASYGSRVPPIPVGCLLESIPELVRQSIAMAFQRRSAERGRPPEWLVAASDVRLVGIDAGEDTSVKFDVPRLGDAAKAVYKQGELFPSRPDQDDTGFDLLGDVISDVGASNGDSDRFDQNLLDSLRRLKGRKRVLNGQFQEILVSGRRYMAENRAVVNHQTIAAAASLRAGTPPVTRARVVGVLDTVRISTQTFGLKLDDGHEVRGVLSAGELETLLRLFATKQRVVVRGDAVFRPSGQLLLIDAEDIGTAEREPAIWSRVPQPARAGIDARALRKPQGPRSGLAAVLGHWPGEETDEEVRAALEVVS